MNSKKAEFSRSFDDSTEQLGVLIIWAVSEGHRKNRSWKERQVAELFLSTQSPAGVSRTAEVPDLGSVVRLFQIRLVAVGAEEWVRYLPLSPYLPLSLCACVRNGNITRHRDR